MVRNPFRHGRWLAWLLLDKGSPVGEFPSRWSLTWNTRSVRQDQVEHYWSEGARAGVVPCVEAWLFSVRVRRWFGRPLTFWRTEQVVQVFTTGPRDTDRALPTATFERSHSFAVEADAWQDFAIHQGVIRSRLVGESRSPYRVKEG